MLFRTDAFREVVSPHPGILGRCSLFCGTTQVDSNSQQTLVPYAVTTANQCLGVFYIFHLDLLHGIFFFFFESPHKLVLNLQNLGMPKRGRSTKTNENGIWGWPRQSKN